MRELLTEWRRVPKLPAVEARVAKQDGEAPDGNDPKDRERRQSAGEVEVERYGESEKEKKKFRPEEEAAGCCRYGGRHQVQANWVRCEFDCGGGGERTFWGHSR